MPNLRQTLLLFIDVMNLMSVSNVSMLHNGVHFSIWCDSRVHKQISLFG